MEVVVWAEEMPVKAKAKAIVNKAGQRLERLAVILSLLPDLGVGAEGEGSVDMVSPEA
jgi:hypothetical protein